VPTEVKVARLADLGPGTGLAVYVGGRDVALFNLGGEVVAIGNECPHQSGSLGDGQLEGEIVICPLHGWEFDARSGACMTVPGESVPRFRVRIEADEILVELPD
jgi:3-phenylpropionate/trans-cinnamate dioxygenase ferredoxin component